LKIVHNITLNAGKEEIDEFEKIGLVLTKGLTTFGIEESDPRWRKIELLVSRFQAADSPVTSFSEQELSDSKFLGLVPEWLAGYPQPADDFGYLKCTFDLSEYCAVCGIGKRQHAPFRLKKAPSWGRRSLMQLNWIFDEFFATGEVWEQVFRPLGIGKRDVVLHKTGEIIPNVVQLEIKDARSLTWHSESTVCTACGRRKFSPIARGHYPLPTEQGFVMGKSRESFGSGGDAHQLVLISEEIFRRMREAQLKGAATVACAASAD
jgi:hypothetical protein